MTDSPAHEAFNAVLASRGTRKLHLVVGAALDAALKAERERLFMAIRHGIPLDRPWRGEALDLIYAVWQDQP